MEQARVINTAGYDVAPTTLLKILVVDDEATNRMVLDAMLKKDGYAVIMAENGKEAIEVFEKEQPDMVLMDVMMPVMDGYQATTVIKSLTIDRFVPVFFLTAMTDEKSLAKCIDSGGDDFLTKPFSKTILKAKIDALMRMRSLYTTVQDQRNQLSYHAKNIEREHEIAERIFKRIIRSDALNVPNLKYLLSPVALFNGDILLAAPRPKGGQHIMLGDFTGHGLSAAVGAMPAAEIFYSMTEKGYSIQDIAAEINEKLYKTLPTGLFCAACIIDVDINNNKISVWNGGIPDVIVYSKGKGIKKIFNSTKLPLGVLSSGKFSNDIQIIEMDIGDRIYLYSDGVIEATNSTGEMFGQDRLELCFAKNNHNEMFESIVNELNEFRFGNIQDDDITLIEILFDESIKKENINNNSYSTWKNPGNWNISFELGPEILKAMEPLPAILHVLLEVQGLYAHRGRLYTILAELYTNALDHGVLRLDSSVKTTPEGFAEFYMLREQKLSSLDSGLIKISLTNKPHNDGGQIQISIEDSGTGFNFNSYQEQKDHKIFSGRGIALVKSLCSDIKYNEKGNSVSVIYDW